MSNAYYCDICGKLFDAEHDYYYKYKKDIIANCSHAQILSMGYCDVEREFDKRLTLCARCSSEIVTKMNKMKKKYRDDE